MHEPASFGDLMYPQPHDVQPSPPTSRGGGGPRRSIGRIVVGVLVVAYLGAMTSAITAGIIAKQRAKSSHVATAPACALEPAMTVAAAPEIAPVVAEVVRTGVAKQALASGCPAPQVRAERASDVLDAIRTQRSDQPDVWIPDSSVWTRQTMPAGLSLPAAGASVARSPMVLAVPHASAPFSTRGSLTIASLLPARADAGMPLRWGLPDPQSNPATVAAVLALRQATAGRGDGPGILGNVLRTSQRDLPASADGQLDAAVAGHLSVPTSEQAVWAWNAKHPASLGVVALRLGTPGYSFDYPFVVLASRLTHRDEAARLLADLQAPAGREALAEAGFRDAQGAAPSGAQSAQVHTASLRPDVGTVPDAAAVRAATQALGAVTRGSRVLAVIDVSGSMSTPVPGVPGATRLDLALRAAANGLALYPDDTEAGLWTFSTHLTPTTDYAVKVPIVPLGAGTDGISGRLRLAQALQSVTVKPQGNTGLYDTALAAVREVRRGWDPNRANVVVLITDGANDDDQGLTLPQLLSTLRKENDPARPVALFAIAYGPASDVPALTAITNATGGRTYAARDPRAIGQVLMDAVGRRACSGGAC
jgi:Ca-activated chloride channel homolog